MNKVKERLIDAYIAGYRDASGKTLDRETAEILCQELFETLLNG